MDTKMLYFNQKQGKPNKERRKHMNNLIETVQYYEDLRRLSEIEDVNSLEIAAVAKRISDIQDDKINYHLLKDLQYYGELLKAEQELIICIKDIIYAVGNDDQTKISIKIHEGDCFKVVGFGHDTISFKSFNGGLAITMKKNTFRYYFGVINSKGKSIKEFFNSKIFKEMDNEDEN